MKKLWKRNAVVGTILVFVCAAIFLNGKYAEKVEQPTKILGQAQQVSGADAAAAETAVLPASPASVYMGMKKAQTIHATAKAYIGM